MQHSSPVSNLDRDIEIAQKIADELKSIYHEDFVVDAETKEETGDFCNNSYCYISIFKMAPDTSFLGGLSNSQVKVTVLKYLYPSYMSYDWNEDYPEVKVLFEKYHKLKK